MKPNYLNRDSSRPAQAGPISPVLRYALAGSAVLLAGTALLLFPACQTVETAKDSSAEFSSKVTEMTLTDGLRYEQAPLEPEAPPPPPPTTTVVASSAGYVAQGSAPAIPRRLHVGLAPAPATESQALQAPAEGPGGGERALETGVVAPPPPPTAADFNREAYARIEEQGFKVPQTSPLSTFSVDVDTASYSNARRFLDANQLPPADAVRLEEMVNYFAYDYPVPAKHAEHPFTVTVDGAPCPWAPPHRLVRIGLKGYEVKWDSRPPSNLVFLVDVSGSMQASNKLPLVVESLRYLARRLDRRDRVAIVVYAGSSGLVLPSTTADNTATIEHALARLQAGGGTNGGEGIRLAYRLAREHFIGEGNNRVILATDGDFNVGVTSEGELTRLIEEEARSGVYLTVLGFGTGNYQDSRMEALAQRGNGNYAYVDNAREGRRVFGQQLTGTLLTIARDVKIQVEFNPAHVKGYRLLGYENRALAAEDFANDQKDAGEIGPGHTVTALYEIIPAGADTPVPADSTLRYQTPAAGAAAGRADGELLYVKLRYKRPGADTSVLLEQPFRVSQLAPAVTGDLAFASAVAEAALLLRRSEHAGQADWKAVLQRAAAHLGADPAGDRAEFLELASRAARLSRRDPAAPTAGVAAAARD